MAWMSEAEYELRKDSRDKKITARSARSTRTHCGKRGAVKFPSDYLTKKEKEAMNGKCETYRLNSPMSWKEFKSMPKDLQKDYVKTLRKTYGVPNKALAEMFGVSSSCVNNYLPTIGLAVGKGAGASKRGWDGTKFWAWCGLCEAETPVEETATDELVAVNEDADIQINPHEIADETIVRKDSAIPESVIRGAAELLNDAFADTFKNSTDETPHICDNPYHHIPVIPSSGTMTFENNNAEDILATIRSMLHGVRVNMTITWEYVGGCND